MKSLPIVGGWLAISGSYYLSKEYVLMTRLKRNDKAKWYEIIQPFLCCTAISITVAGLVGVSPNSNVLNSTVLSVFIVLVISSFYGLLTGYEADSKLSDSDKDAIRYKKMKDNREMNERGYDNGS